MFKKTVLIKSSTADPAPVYCCSEGISTILKDSSNHLDEKIFHPQHNRKGFWPFFKLCIFFVIQTKMVARKGISPSSAWEQGPMSFLSGQWSVLLENLLGCSKITGYLFFIKLNARLGDLNAMVLHEAQTGAAAKPSISHTCRFLETVVRPKRYCNSYSLMKVYGVFLLNKRKQEKKKNCNYVLFLNVPKASLQVVFLTVSPCGYTHIYTICTPHTHTPYGFSWGITITKLAIAISTSHFVS